MSAGPKPLLSGGLICLLVATFGVSRQWHGLCAVCTVENECTGSFVTSPQLPSEHWLLSHVRMLRRVLLPQTPRFQNTVPHELLLPLMFMGHGLLLLAVCIHGARYSIRNALGSRLICQRITAALSAELILPVFPPPPTLSGHRPQHIIIGCLHAPSSTPTCPVLPLASVHGYRAPSPCTSRTPRTVRTCRDTPLPGYGEVPTVHTVSLFVNPPHCLPSVSLLAAASHPFVSEPRHTCFRGYYNGAEASTDDNITWKGQDRAARERVRLDLEEAVWCDEHLDSLMTSCLEDFLDDNESELAEYAAGIARGSITDRTRDGHARIIKAYIVFHKQHNTEWDPTAVTGQTPYDIRTFITHKCGEKNKGYEGKRASDTKVTASSQLPFRPAQHSVTGTGTVDPMKVLPSGAVTKPLACVHETQ
ncbi:hypothetical protein DEU56DRAFT_933869 [Suillus clintonianus]|uniref:uncharacterized protein n=1 Tax=Suillus clintonianus TaxID=1904413 RepID=UPI001B8710BF|nr:uncharacterized protein DEU56DRAFT_933869 [Suillus clintonianus]KAG2114380.1 hypothetical protein DEU56DRAFT_933869 [Suillus clintonianus]